jgi:poly-gamma-glutamate synthesis protein (capsule biosynthesis protein)
VATAVGEPVRTLAKASIGAVGDVLMHAAVQRSAADHVAPGDEGGYGWLWAPVADLLGGTDLTFANLETPVAPRSGGATRSFLFNADERAVAALRRAGVGLVGIANNHILDQGRAGLEETVEQLDRLGMPYVGAGPAGREPGPRILTLNGIRVAFLAYARFLNQSGNDCPAIPRARPCVRASLLDADRAIADVGAAAAAADAVVVSLHWGEEYADQPREQDVALAHRLADAGALIVLGHHPHVLQPLEVYRRADGASTLIAYSLGNFVSNQSRSYVHGVTPASVAATRHGVLLRAELVRRDYGRGITRVELGGVGWFPLWTENDTADPERRAAGRRPSIRVVSVDRALAATREELRALPDPLPRELQARFVALRQREELLSAQRAAIAAVLGEDLERTAPPPAQAAVTPAASR